MRSLLRRILTFIVAPCSGLDLIATEREYQLAQKGYSDEHDDTHIDGEMAMAAACFAAPKAIQVSHSERTDAWPESWHRRHDKRMWPRAATPMSLGRLKLRIQELTVAGALIAAEIDRLQRSRTRVTELNRVYWKAAEVGRATAVRAGASREPVLAQ